MTSRGQMSRAEKNREESSRVQESREETSRVDNPYRAVYWCTLCNALHKGMPGSEESVLRTGWRTIDGINYNIGFCNGVHRDPEAPKHLGGQLNLGNKASEL